MMGIFSGHIYHFFSKIWPALGGDNYISTPKWLIKLLPYTYLSSSNALDYRNINRNDNKNNKIKKKIVKKDKMIGGKKLGSTNSL
jgi:hypothetical protein